MHERLYNNNHRKCLIYHSHIIFIWRTKHSVPAITEEFERNMLHYILGICNRKDCHPYRMNCMPDHIHLCIAISPTISVSEFVRVVKQESSKWMKEHPEWFPRFDGWANGYAAFTYSLQERPVVVEYIKNQKIHHHHKSFVKEYTELMERFGLDPNTWNYKD